MDTELIREAMRAAVTEGCLHKDQHMLTPKEEEEAGWTLEFREGRARHVFIGNFDNEDLVYSRIFWEIIDELHLNSVIRFPDDFNGREPLYLGATKGFSSFWLVF